MQGLQTLPLSSILTSTTKAQAERRAHFDKAALVELAESIKTVGLLQPLVVRPTDPQDGCGQFWEIVAGERRYLAAELAGLAEVPCSVRELTDEQVLEVQLVENLQRVDLHELVEAEGYEQLQQLGHSVEEIAAKVGKSKGTVYARCKLLTLCKEGRAAFRTCKITASVALLLARIPVEELQKKALKEVTQSTWGSEDGMSVRRATDHIHETYMLRLGEAEFKTEDATLLPAAGACGPCPKRTGNQPELFGDVKGADVCTDPVCFKAKLAANCRRVLAAAEERGQKIIAGKDLKKIAPHGTQHGLQGYVRLDDRDYSGSKPKTIRQVLGKDFEPTLLHDPDSGRVIEVAPDSAVRKAQPDRPRSANTEQSDREKKAKRERLFRSELYKAIRPRLPEVLRRVELELIALVLFDRLDNEVQKTMLKLWQWEPSKPKGYESTMRATGRDRIPKLNDSELSAFLLDCCYAGELRTFTWSESKPEMLLAAAARFKIDPEKIRKEVAAEAAANKKPAKPTPAKKSATKKGARKPK